MEDISQTKFEEITIFNQVKLNEYFDKTYTTGSEENKVYICGKLFSHSISSKYSFKACDFLIYIPADNKLFYTAMHSEECFTSTLKWNQNFFKKIRLCIESSEGLKNTYFALSYEKKIDITINSKGNAKNNILQNDEEENENEYSDKKIFLDLHFIVDDQDILAFRMLLNHLIDDKPYNTLLNKLLEYDKEESEKIIQKQKKLFEKQKEIEKMENQIAQAEDGFMVFKKQSLYKLYYINKEKNKKISELNNELRKEKKIAFKFK